jgi:hypothetical protein
LNIYIKSTEQHDEQKQALAKDVFAEHDEHTNRSTAWYRSFAEKALMLFMIAVVKNG